MKLFLVLILVVLGLMAIRRSISRAMYTGGTSPRDQQRRTREEARRREGEVTIDTSGSKRGDNRDDDGDYVDYEEVK